MDLFHAFVDLGLDAGSLMDGLSPLVWVKLVSLRQGGLIDPVSADGFAEYVESGLVVFGDHVGVVGFSSSGHWRVDTPAVGWVVYEEEGDVDGAALDGGGCMGQARSRVHERDRRSGQPRHLHSVDETASDAGRGAAVDTARRRAPRLGDAGVDCWCTSEGGAGAARALLDLDHDGPLQPRDRGDGPRRGRGCRRAHRTVVRLRNEQRTPFLPGLDPPPGHLESGEIVDYQDRITTEPGKRGGKPIIRGLRMTVYDVLDYLASGMSEEEILSDFPELEQEDIRACLAFAADRERKLVSGA